MTQFTGTNLNETIAPTLTPEAGPGAGRANTPVTTDQPAPNNSFLNGVPLPQDIFTGDDVINGLDGDDFLDGSTGNDSLDGGDGRDELIGGNGGDTLIGGDSTGLGFAASNLLDGGDGNDWASYRDIADNLTVNLNDSETEIPFFLAPVAFPDIVATVPDETGTTDFEFGEDFDDFVLAGAGFSRATHGFNRDRFLGFQTIENVEGASNRQNQIAGNEDDNILIGGNLQDTLFGGSEGADTLRGQAGNDSYVVDPSVIGGNADAGGTVIEDTAGTDRLGFFGGPAVTVVAGAPTNTPGTIGMARFGNDLVLDLNQDGTANAPDDLTIKNFYNGSGAAGSGFIEQLGNLNAQDVLTANLPDQGGAAMSSTSPTRSSTDPGTTTPLVDTDGNPLENTVFTDSVSGITSYIFTNHAENPADLNNLTGNERGLYTQALNGHDNVTGTVGSDNINGNQGDDIINGGNGDDGDRTVTIPVNQVRTALRGGRGGDQVFGEAGGDILNGNQDNDILDGGDGNDIVRGGQGDDIVIGGNGSDFLFGDLGKDVLIGGTLTGNTVNPDGAQDIFELKDPGVANPADADLIRGFEDGTDLLLLPQNVTFANLTINPIQLTVDAGTSVQSSQIVLNGQTLALVEGVIPNNLNATDFTSLSATVAAGGGLTNEQIALFG